MKTKLIIEIETKEIIGVLPEEGRSEDDYTQEELDSFRKQYCEDFHKAVISDIKDYFENGEFQEFFIDSLEELYIDGFGELKDYGTTIKISENGDE